MAPHSSSRETKRRSDRQESVRRRTLGDTVGPGSSDIRMLRAALYPLTSAEAVSLLWLQAQNPLNDDLVRVRALRMILLLMGRLDGYRSRESGKARKRLQSMSDQELERIAKELSDA